MMLTPDRTVQEEVEASAPSPAGSAMGGSDAATEVKEVEASAPPIHLVEGHCRSE